MVSQHKWVQSFRLGQKQLLAQVRYKASQGAKTRFGLSLRLGLRPVIRKRVMAKQQSQVSLALFALLLCQFFGLFRIWNKFASVVIHRSRATQPVGTSDNSLSEG